MVMNQKVLTVILFSISIGNSFSQSPDIEKLMVENNIVCTGIGIIKDGKLTSTMVYGELQKGKKAPKNTVFNVASMTKPVVAMVTLKLVNSNQWNLDEPLAKYWTDPDVSNDPRSKQLTSRHVLTHQTGFVNWRWLHPTKKLAFDFDPGTKFGYSGEGFEYLKNALERKFKKSLVQLAQELVFTPLQMNDSRLIWNDSIEYRYAANHDREGRAVYKTVKRTEPSAADDLLTTVEDYGKFCMAVMNGFELNKDIYQDMVTPHVEVRKNVFMGLGWEVVPLNNKQYVLGHSGSDQGVKAIALFNPVSKDGLIFLTNSDNGFSIAEKAFTEMMPNGPEIVQKLTGQ
jgi:CubicO group peptidase (beta-lactamase class C family)